MVQILATWTSKSAPTMPVFNDFDFQIVLAQAWCKFWRLQLPKVLPHPQFLTILTSKPLSRAGVVQILATWTSKSARTMPVFNDFDFQIVLARRRGVNYATSWAADPLRARPCLGGDFPSQRSDKTMEKHSLLRASYPPNPHVSHLCCINLSVDRAPAATLSIVGS